MRAKYSGLSEAPPWKLNPRNAGRSNSKGAPRLIQTTSGRPNIAATATGQTEGLMPVASCFRRARLFQSSVTMQPATKASSAQLCAVSHSNSGNFMPRLDRKAMLLMCHDCFGPGRPCRMVYQNSSCSSSGMSRSVST